MRIKADGWGIGIYTLIIAIAAGVAIELTREQWAYWVQAIGSIGAIAGAAYIASSQTRRMRTEKLRDDLQNTVIALQIIERFRSYAFYAAQEAEVTIRETSGKDLNIVIDRVDRLRVGIEAVFRRNTDRPTMEFALQIHGYLNDTIVQLNEASVNGNFGSNTSAKCQSIARSLNKILQPLTAHIEIVGRELAKFP